MKGRGAWCSGRNRTCFFGSSFAAAAIEGEGGTAYCICIPGMSGSDRLSDRLKGGKFPIQEIVNQWYQSSNEVNHLGNFEIITWKLGTLYIVLLSFRDATTYRGGDDAEFAIMKFSVTSKSNPNIYVWSRSQVQIKILFHCCNHWKWFADSQHSLLLIFFPSPLSLQLRF